MTIQALAWAIDQPVPGKAKLVLLALANRTDHLNGRCEFDADAVSRESSLTVRGIWPYVGALVRNGYVRRDDGNVLWLVLDRPALPAWEWHQQADIDAEEDIEAAPSIATAAPVGFDPQRQSEQRKQLAVKAAEQKPTAFFVLEDSRAWRAWCEHRRSLGQVPSMPTCNGVGEYAGRRGWWMPSLFPPEATPVEASARPSSKPLATEQELKEFADSG